ncbi:MAG: RNase adapter RapZ [Oscillospiraceae bacterium]
MEFIIVTGLSGAGKSRAIDAMEDIGFYCVDNLPPTMIPVFYDLCLISEGMPQKVAVVTDTRGGELFKSFFDALATLAEQKRNCKILFLDASDSVLVNRYQETRRKHPLSESVNGSLEKAVKLEREMLKPMQARADYVINTTGLAPQNLKERISKLFLNNVDESMMVHCVSFGFKHGIPLESDLLFDVRCLPNPFYVDELRNLTGLDRSVCDFIFEKEESIGFRDRLAELIDFLLPLYLREGKSQLVISIGCTGGHHRSVAFAQYLHDHIEGKGIRASVNHRDIVK